MQSYQMFSRIFVVRLSHFIRTENNICRSYIFSLPLCREIAFMLLGFINRQGCVTLRAARTTLHPKLCLGCRILKGIHFVFPRYKI
jgi:hypothetical protein